MNWTAITRNVGFALLVSALFMLVSVGVSMLDGNDSALAALIISFTITFTVGVFPFIFVRKTAPVSLKDGYMIITLSWLLSFVFGMLPYALWGGPFTLQNAWFESVSGFTTTGATILDDIESLPRSLLFWRSATHFIGGLGVVVFLLLIIPNSSPIKMRLTNMELSSLSKGAYSVRANRTVYVFAYVYLGLGLVAFVSYILAGMPVFDAVCHAMSVCAAGGFSSRNLSIASFDSTLIEFLTMIFMLAASIHFGLIYLSIVTRSLKPMRNPVLRFYLATLAIFSVLVAASIKLSGHAPTWGSALWQGTFQTISSASTTGFAISDNAQWPLLPNMLLLSMAVMCGCAGSCTGGLKSDRVLILAKSFGRQIGKILHPSSVNEIRLGTRLLKDEDAAPHVMYVTLYAVILAFSVLFALVLGVDDQSAFAASISSLGNLGPATRDLGLMGSFNSIPGAAKVLFTLDMFMGRVEIYPVLAVVAMLFDRRKR